MKEADKQFKLEMKSSLSLYEYYFISPKPRWTGKMKGLPATHTVIELMSVEMSVSVY